MVTAGSVQISSAVLSSTFPSPLMMSVTAGVMKIWRSCTACGPPLSFLGTR